MSYQLYKEAMQSIADINYAAAVLQWDQETYMPAKGAERRGQQLATLAEIAHARFTDERIGNMLEDLLTNDKLTIEEKRNVTLSQQDYIRNKKIPSLFVKQQSEAITICFHAWIKSRKENDFSTFQKPLSHLIGLKQQEAEYLGYEGHPYDALMNDYDKGLTVAKADKLFGELQPQLQSIVDKATALEVDDSFLYNHYDKDKQWQLGLQVLAQMGYDFEAGRQDISEHPFTTNFSSQDVRVTTHTDENNFSAMLWSCIHEGGHALYEQGLPAQQYGLPLGEYNGLSIHESQSRIWENCIGRGLPYWKQNFAVVQQHFPQQLQGISLEHFYKAINKVKPSLIRINADELTYHQHVIIRYEIEKQLIEGSLSAADVPAVWNEMYKKRLGVIVPDDRSGCLQDVHWSHGSFGYFPTYSIGSLYAAQFYAAIKKVEPKLEEQIALGDFTRIHSWLAENVFRHGKFYSAEDLCKEATGEALNAAHFIQYAKAKFENLSKMSVVGLPS